MAFIFFMAGRPFKYTREELKVAVDNYFNEEIKPTLAGLALALDIDRQTLYNYAEVDELFDIIKKARERVEAKYEQRLIYESNPTGVIFALKNMGWKDKTEQDIRYPEGINLSFEKAPSFLSQIETKGSYQNQNGTKMLHTKGGDVPL
jgi:hypothetical protein